MCIHQEKERITQIEALTGTKISINSDQSYLEEVIPKTKILGYKNFEENGKEKYKQKKKEEFAERMKYYKKMKQKKKDNKKSGIKKKKKR